MIWAVKPHHSPVDWNLLGNDLGSYGCTVMEVDPATVDFENCPKEHDQREAQDRLCTAEEYHMVDK